MAASWSHGQLGIVLAGEEHSARRLVELGIQAENAGFGFCFVSDHFHPWNLSQGHSSYIWSVLGALAVQTDSIALVSAVVSPILRVHPTTLAQAASTIFHLSNGRFYLGLGTGENLNEHIVGEGFPPYTERLARLEDSIELVRKLLSGVEVSHQGSHFKVDRAQLFDAAPELSIYLAASGSKTAKLAHRAADGLICLGARAELAGAVGPKTKLTQISVCWGENLEQAQQTAHAYFPEVAMPGTLFAELATPSEFAQAASSVSVQDVAASIICGPDPGPYRAAIQECLDAGFDAVALHQIGPEQDAFVDFCRRELL